jgi:hypothetical protein
MHHYCHTSFRILTSAIVHCIVATTYFTSWKKSQRPWNGPPQLIHIPVNCPLRNSVAGVQKCGGGHLAARQIHQAQFSRMSKYTAHVTPIPWKRNGLITPALANLNYTFYFGLSHLCCLTSWRFHNSPNAAIMVVNFTWHVKTSLITEVHPNEVVTVAVYPRDNVGSKSSALSEATEICMLWVSVMHCIIHC